MLNITRRHFGIDETEYVTSSFFASFNTDDGGQGHVTSGSQRGGPALGNCSLSKDTNKARLYTHDQGIRKEEIIHEVHE